MKAKGLRYFLITLLAILTAFSVIGCGSSSGGGGGDSSSASSTPTVSGVAATGAPMTGKVTLRDSSTPVKELVQDPINPNGSYSFNVTGLTPPFYLCADDNGNKLYSVSMNSGTGNINPLTNIIAAALGGNDPATLYNNPPASIDQNVFNQALTDLNTFMSDLLSDYGVPNINPLTDPFTANGTGLDGLFDDVRVDISGGNVTLYDGLGNQLGQAPVNDLQHPTAPVDHTGSTPLVITVLGAGYFQSQGLEANIVLNIDESSLSTSSLIYSYKNTFCQSTSIAQVTANSGIVTIKGTCNMGNFTVKVSKNPYSLDMQIVDAGGTVHPDSITSQSLVNGGFTITIQ